MKEHKIKHLEMIQNVIDRMASNSFMIKGWTITLVSALFALAAKDSDLFFIYLAYFPAIAFWILDAFYLWQERLFRALYDNVRQIGDDTKIDFSMNREPFRKIVDSWLAIMISRTLLIFHGVILISISIVMIILLIVKYGGM